jgi:Ca2+-binding RTX toxin-like protein
LGIRLVVGKEFSLDMSSYDFTGVDDAEITTFTASKITGVAGQFKLTVTGQGFDHDNNGYLTEGVVESVKLSYHGRSVVSLTGADVSVEKLIDVVNTSTPNDDVALLKTTLRGDDYMSGSNYSDLLYGYNGDDALIGKGGADRIRAGAGDDSLIGGAGADQLWGGDGTDAFVFKSISDSKASSFDTIHDFSIKDGDRISLDSVDANSDKHGDQDFRFIGADDFHRAGDLRVEKFKDDTYVQGDADGDGHADFVIRLDGAIHLDATVFAL